MSVLTLKKRIKQYCRRIERWLYPISQPKLHRALKALIPANVNVLLVHSSLSSCGQFAGGPQSILDELGKLTSTLVMPTHTYCYPESPNSEGPVFDSATTASCNGLLTEIFRSDSNVTRSIHATHSLAARGPQSRQITSLHWHCNTPCGQGTPYQRLLETRASVLLFGVSLNSYTLYHTAEDAAESPCAYEANTLDHLRVLDEQRQVQVCPSKRQSRAPRRFAEVGEHLVQIGLARKISLGKNYLTFVPDCGAVHDYLVPKLRRFPDYLYCNCPADFNS